MGIIFLDAFAPRVMEKPAVEITTFEFILVEASFNTRKIILLCVYRPPNTHIPTCIDEFQALTLDLLDIGNQLPIAWDFNIPVNKSSPTTNDLLDTLNDLGFENTVEDPTFIRSGNTLDLVLDFYPNSFIRNTQVHSGPIGQFPCYL